MLAMLAVVDSHVALGLASGDYQQHQGTVTVMSL